jgi:hypothetical protein
MPRAPLHHGRPLAVLAAVLLVPLVAVACPPAVHAVCWASGAAAEEESQVFGLTHRVATDRPYFLLSYVAATGSAWQVDPSDPSENLLCRVNDLRLAVGGGRDLGPFGLLAQASLRVGLTSNGSPQAGPLQPSCTGLRIAAFWDLAQPGSGHLRLQAVHRRVRWRYGAGWASENGGSTGSVAPGAWAGSTMLEAAWGRFVGGSGIFSARAAWDLGGSSWTSVCSVAAHMDYRRYVNRRTYLQVGAVIGFEPLNPGLGVAIGNAPYTHAGMDVSGWVRTLGWEVGLDYRPDNDEPCSGTLLKDDSLLMLSIRLMR